VFDAIEVIEVIDHTQANVTRDVFEPVTEVQNEKLAVEKKQRAKEEKDKVSPRRLQYALDIYLERGDMRDVLPPSCNVNKLIQILKNGPITDRLDFVMNARSISGAKKMMENENDFDSAIKYILKSTDYLDFYGPLLPNEKISALLDSSDDFCNHAITSISKHPVFHKICKDVMEANQNAKLCKKIRRHLTEFPEVAKMFNEKPNMASNC
jgi:hypothetical protein